MKVRNDYVSNSSSSSFIIADTDFFKYFNITKKDILDALVDAYGIECYEQCVVDNHVAAKKFMKPEEYEHAKKVGGFGPFYVYDLSNPKEREDAIERWGSLLEDWRATNCAYEKRGSDKVVLGMGNGHYNKVIEGVADAYNVICYELENIDESDPPKRFVRENEKDPITGMYGHYEVMPDYVIDFCKNLKKDCGVMNNLEVLKHEVARFFVHFDDNEVSGLAGYGVDASTDGFKSEYYTYDRVCEIVFNYLVKVGKINPKDEGYLADLAYEDTDNFGNKKTMYDTANGEDLSYLDMVDATMTNCMHEG